MVNLDELIILELKGYGGRVRKDWLWNYFKNYSKGYLSERIHALKHSSLIVERFSYYELTKAGWSVKVEEMKK